MLPLRIGFIKSVLEGGEKGTIVADSVLKLMIFFIFLMSVLSTALYIIILKLVGG